MIHMRKESLVDSRDVEMYMWIRNAKESLFLELFCSTFQNFRIEINQQN